MPTPQDQPPKKPNGPPAQGKPAGAPQNSGKPPLPGKPVPAKPQPPSKPGAKPPVPPTKPTAGKQPAKPAPAKPGGAKKGGPAPKPTAAKSSGASHGGRRLGQVLVDLGLIDEDQLWEILDEAKSNNQLTGQVAVARGLITEEQLLGALAEQHGLKLVNIEEMKPTSEALQMVPETMASVYKIVPLSVKDKVLTIAMGDPSNLAAIDDLRNLLGIPEVVVQLASPKVIADALTKIYAGKEESIIDIIQALESDSELGPRGRESSIDLES